jgi:hypothetical protein
VVCQATGERVKLESVRIAGRTMVSVEGFDRWIAALNPNSAPSPIRTPSQRSKASEQAGRELQQLWSKDRRRPGQRRRKAAMA